MNKIPTISVGIPAYNEERNIQNLLKSILSQEGNNFVLKEIIIVSDGSSDKTVQKVKAIKDKRIHIYHDSNRLGKSNRMNFIFKHFTGNLLFLMDADIFINDKQLFAKVVDGGNFLISGLACTDAAPLPARNAIEKALEASILIMKDISNRWNKDQNYLPYKGCFLALYGKFAKSLYMPDISTNDAYIYFQALIAGYHPRIIKNTAVYYKSPSTLQDHKNQSLRHSASGEELQKYFGEAIKEQYIIPTQVSLISTLKYLLLRPVPVLYYIILRMLTNSAKKSHKNVSAWNIASSTKHISYE
jgi:glycosyltransferase involved in cell wall biosynthesis